MSGDGRKAAEDVDGLLTLTFQGAVTSQSVRECKSLAGLQPSRNLDAPMPRVVPRTLPFCFFFFQFSLLFPYHFRAEYCSKII